MRKLLTTIVAAVIVAALIRTGSAAGNAASKRGSPVAYAKAEIATPRVVTFGGKGTTSAVVSGGDTNAFIDVTFTGHYPATIAESNVIINVTAESNDYGVGNAYCVSANKTQIVVEVYGWVSDTEVSNGETVFFTVFLGQ